MQRSWATIFKVGFCTPFLLFVCKETCRIGLLLECSIDNPQVWLTRSQVFGSSCVRFFGQAWETGEEAVKIGFAHGISVSPPEDWLNDVSMLSQLQ